jgi:hypothetical protein
VDRRRYERRPSTCERSSGIIGQPRRAPSPKLVRPDVHVPSAPNVHPATVLGPGVLTHRHSVRPSNARRTADRRIRDRRLTDARAGKPPVTHGRASETPKRRSALLHVPEVAAFLSAFCSVRVSHTVAVPLRRTRRSRLLPRCNASRCGTPDALGVEMHRPIARGFIARGWSDLEREVPGAPNARQRRRPNVRSARENERQTGQSRCNQMQRWCRSQSSAYKAGADPTVG